MNDLERKTAKALIKLGIKNFTFEGYPYYWRVKTRLPERKGEPCKVLVRAKMNSCLVEFTDGYKVVTSRNYIRKQSGAYNAHS